MHYSCGMYSVQCTATYVLWKMIKQPTKATARAMDCSLNSEIDNSRALANITNRDDWGDDGGRQEMKTRMTFFLLFFKYTIANISFLLNSVFCRSYSYDQSCFLFHDLLSDHTQNNVIFIYIHMDIIIEHVHL